MRLRLREHPEFTRFWLARGLSSTGTMMRELTIGWLVLEATGSELWLAGTALARVGAMLLLIPFGSSLADRRSKRSVILVAESGSLAVSLVLFAAALSGHLPPVALVLAAATLGGIHAFEAPARNVLVHGLVSGDTLLPALSLLSTANGVARVLGPAIGGLLLDRIGAAACFLVDAATYVVFLAVVASLPRDAPEDGADSGGSLFRTAKAAWSAPAVRRVLLLLVVVSVIAGSYKPLMPAVASGLLGLGADGLGGLQASAALGAIFAGLLLGRGLVAESEARVLPAAALLLPLPLAVLSFSPGVLAAAAAVAGVAGLVTAGEAAANTRLQRLAPVAARARHVGLYTILVHCFPIGGWVLALGAAAMGLRGALLALAALVLLLAAGLARGPGREAQETSAG